MNRFIRAAGFALPALVVALLAGCDSRPASPDDDKPVVVVTMIDITPDAYVAGNEDDAHDLFNTYVVAVRAAREPGFVSIDMLQEEDAPNHFVMIEEWKTRADADRHTTRVATKSFRDTLQKLLGSPFDQRMVR